MEHWVYILVNSFHLSQANISLPENWVGSLAGMRAWSLVEMRVGYWVVKRAAKKVDLRATNIIMNISDSSSCEFP